LLIPSFTQEPSGDEKFKMTLAAPFGFSLHIRPLTFALAGRSLGSKWAGGETSGHPFGYCISDLGCGLVGAGCVSAG